MYYLLLLLYENYEKCWIIDNTFCYTYYIQTLDIDKLILIVWWPFKEMSQYKAEGKYTERAPIACQRDAMRPHNSKVHIILSKASSGKSSMFSLLMSQGAIL